MREDEEHRQRGIENRGIKLPGEAGGSRLVRRVIEHRRMIFQRGRDRKRYITRKSIFRSSTDRRVAWVLLFSRAHPRRSGFAKLSLTLLARPRSRLLLRLLRPAHLVQRVVFQVTKDTGFEIGEITGGGTRYLPSREPRGEEKEKKAI